MRTARATSNVLSALLALAAGAITLGAIPSASGQQTSPETTLWSLEPDRILDGRGNVLAGRVIVDGDRIASVGGSMPPGARRVRLEGLTLLPGLIDTHVHLDWSFDRNGRTPSDESPDSEAERTLAAAQNARRTLLAGVTTVQSLGGVLDVPLRDAIEADRVAGPRVLTSIRPISSATGDPDAIRAEVERIVEDGADVIKIFASKSIRDGGAPTLSQEQLDAACGRAKELGLRSVVHAHSAASALRSARAGCTAIEHGALLERESLELLARLGVFFDPHIDLVLRNYIENRDRFEGVGNYSKATIDLMAAEIPGLLNKFREALTVENLQIVFGTDALAGAHGRNVEELVYRIEVGGQDPMDGVLSATLRAARSLELDHEIGTITPGLQADLIAVAGDPLATPKSLLDVRFVMKGGTIHRAP